MNVLLMNLIFSFSLLTSIAFVIELTSNLLDSTMTDFQPHNLCCNQSAFVADVAPSPW